MIGEILESGDDKELYEVLDLFPQLDYTDRIIIKDAYQAIQDRYGTQGQTGYKPYHNHTHALSVLNRALTICDRLAGALPHHFNEADMRALAVAAVYHDYEQDFKEFGANEQLSANAAIAAIWHEPSYDGSEFLEKIEAATLATIVSRNESGSIIQSNIRTGSKDPIKLILAMADINGIAMGGVRVMVEDATNLFMEINGFTTSSEVLAHAADFGKFLQSQAMFLRDRLGNVDGDIDYYFADNEERALVKQIFFELFKPGNDALKVASILEAPPEVISCLNSLVQSGVSSVAELKQRLLSFLPGQTSRQN